MLNFVFIYLIFSLFDLFKNLSYLYETNSLIEKIDNNRGEADKLSEYKNQIIVLLQRASVSDESFVKEYYTDHQLVVQNSSILTAYPYFDVEDRILNMLRNAKGFYKRSVFRNLNPIFLIERFFRMPSYVLQQMNLNKSTKVNGILNTMWAIVFWLFTPFLENLRIILFEFLANLI